MHFDDLRAYLQSKAGTFEDFPFGPEPLVAKVRGKMFALVSFRKSPLRISLKCDPNYAIVLRETYPAIQAGYHLNKRHWNTVTLDGSIPEEEVLKMIDQSYKLVVKSLPKAQQQNLESSQ
ncbi:MAG: MmcQ/YjbR family DNA-binding protein [Chloroflexi bacterium AL-W]|nr:MmcQ/YjbR family DNA-binding protein [Chloroflexi bacterium AL-N1]NOK67651.1 MmcQ/YjbR family DNA-binding protein [Chloroflexi bacterium AL-N10]NOK75579.1 MmcQ/YjbR family DNA-binding protein [Chloroflexi bacterium AL-N5]NOK82367.1 MmcQ/YjbR family DNA-binding protein [Chloroflexi bacterium AL-W]NOK90212.1 MmcQ/YjbR family DNA-binding protein [Chloroflexi bacterium AL-N15]